MRNRLKRILPILFALVVICSLVWYLFVYDKDFTRDVLLQQARFFETNGNHAVAQWLYSQAYKHADNNASVAIELAEQYKAIGNYTKAEYTLANAIADGGSAELYIALCKTYVEQDKLLDAVTMLDNIENAQIKAQLDALRPEAPAASPAPGFYNQYLTVTVEATGGTLYLSSGREYPSVGTGASDGAVQLVAGENTVSALVVGSNGLVSPLGVFGYTVGGVIEEVTLKDSVIDAAVRQALGVTADATLYTNDLWKITAFTAPEGAGSFEDLAHLTYLESLVIENSTVDDYHALAALTQLTDLTIRNCILSSDDLMVVSSSPNLQKLTISGCSLSSIEALANAKHLVYLDLSNNAVKNLSALTSLSQLQSLNLSHNALTSLNDLSALEKLDTLDVSYNSLSSITPISACTGLTYLNVSGNMLTNLTGTEHLTNLVSLTASYNKLTDVSAIAGCTNLTELHISNNELANISPLSALLNLQYLDFSRNQVSALPDWGKDNVLVVIDGSYNNLRTISGLAGYPSLNKILMDYNSISSVSALVDCPNLIRLDVYGNPVSNVSALTDLGITVNYTPR